jgi:hypothetical protein
LENVRVIGNYLNKALDIDSRSIPNLLDGRNRL